MFKKIMITVSAIFLTLLLASCGTTERTDSKTGLFLSPVVGGLNYNCQPSNLKGRTTLKGEFKYHKGDQCSFSVGNMELGSSGSAPVITVHKLFGNADIGHIHTVHAVQLLLTLDSDQNKDNGIVLADTAHKAFVANEKLLNLNQQALQARVSKAYPNRTLFDAEDAIEYHSKTIDSIRIDEIDHMELDSKMVSGKRLELVNSEGISHFVHFSSGGLFEDEVHSCKATWSISGASVVIDKSSCDEEESQALSFTFLAPPKEGTVVIITEREEQTVAIVKSVFNDGFSTQSIHGDRDHKHITFVNQTQYGICIEAFISWGKNHKMYLSPHEAKYLNIGDSNLDDDDVIGISYKISESGCKDRHSKSDFPHHYDNDDFNTRDVIYIHGLNSFNKDVHVTEDMSGCDKNASKPAILFAHGYHDTQIGWNKFADLAKDAGWRVFRTSVSYNGSIKKRAHMLNTYIKAISERCNIGDNQLRVVGHSMGGLDLRYILSSNSDEFQDAQDVIERFYTIATPHKGSGFASTGSVFLDDGGKNLTIKHLKDFNDALPYTKIQEHNKTMLALRFHCIADLANTPTNKVDKHAADGVVKVFRQVLYKAPYSRTVFHGKHSPNTYLNYGDCKAATIETHQPRVIEMILEDYDSDPSTDNIGHYNTY